MVMVYQDRHPLSTSTTTDKIYTRNLIAIKVVQCSFFAADTGLPNAVVPTTLVLKKSLRCCEVCELYLVGSCSWARPPFLLRSTCKKVRLESTIVQSIEV